MIVSKLLKEKKLVINTESSSDDDEENDTNGNSDAEEKEETYISESICNGADAIANRLISMYHRLMEVNSSLY